MLRWIIYCINNALINFPYDKRQIQDQYFSSQDKYLHDPGGRDICQCQIKQYLKKLYQNLIILFNDNLPTDLYISFQIIKL